MYLLFCPLGSEQLTAVSPNVDTSVLKGLTVQIHYDFAETFSLCA